MLQILILFVFSFLTLTVPVYGTVPSFQELVDQTPAGATLKPPKGTYAGPVVINKTITVDGSNGVIINGQGKGSILKIEAHGTVIKNLTLTNSGDSHDRLDAGILVRSSRNKIINNIISDSLFGIDLQEAHENLIMGNDVSSKDVPLGLRGDGIRIWASHKNVFRRNKIHDSRDMVIWYSNDNLIEDNEGWNNRYSLHFMFAGGNLVQRNKYHHNTVGIFLMYSRDAIVQHNQVKYSLGGTGIGIGLKEVDNMTIQYNEVVYCTAGFYFDLSPFQPDTYNFIKANKIAFNVAGATFNSTLPRNILKGNAFIGNLETVKVHGNGVATESLWEGNYYSDFEGFDRDADGYGDSYYHYDVYFETLWMDDEWMRFFYGTPVISMVNFLAKLAPISQPRRLMSDTKPVFMKDYDLLFSEKNLFYNAPKINIEDDEGDDEEAPARFSGGDEEDEDEEMPARFAESDEEDDDEKAESDDDNLQKQKKSANYNRYFLKQ